MPRASAWGLCAWRADYTAILRTGNPPRRTPWHHAVRRPCPARPCATRRGGSCRKWSSAVRRIRADARACKGINGCAERRRSRAPVPGLVHSLRAGQEGFRYCQTQGIGTRHHGRFGDRLVFDQDAFQFERADAVVRRLEDVVGTADVGDVTVGIDRGRVTGVIETITHHLGRFLGVVVVGDHQSERTRRQGQTDFTFVTHLAVHIDQAHLVAGHRPSHRAELDCLSGRVANLCGRFGLAETVAQGNAPRLLDLIDDFGVQRLAGADQLANLDRILAQVLLDQHPPDRRWRTQGGHRTSDQSLQNRCRREAGIVVDEHRGAGIPGRKEAAPGMLGPAGGTDVPVHVAGLQPEPVHRRQVPDRIALLAVQYQLGFRGGAGRKVQKLRVGRLGRPVGLEVAGSLVGLFKLLPAGHRAADGDACVVAGQVAELFGVRVADDHVSYLAAVEAVTQVVGSQQRGGRRQHGAKFDRCQHRIPQRHLVAEHHQDAIAALDALRAQPVRDLVRTPGHLGKRHLLFRSVFIDHPQRRAIVARCHHIEIIEGPVEFA